MIPAPPSGAGGLPGLAVARPVTVLMSLLALLTVGGIAWRLIPVQLLPSGFDAPVMWVAIPTLPAAPADNERSVAEPVEEALATMPDLDALRTIVRSDRVVFRVEMRKDADPEGMYAQLQDRLDRVRPRLPEGTRLASIWRHDPNDDPVMILGVVYPESARDPHQDLLTHLARPLERLPGISAVEVEGLRPTQVRIEVDDGAARSAGVDNATIVRSLQDDGFTMALGAVEEGGRRVLVRAVSRFDDLEEIRAVPIAEGTTLGDVATVRFGTDPEPEIHRIDGHAAATLMVYKEASANTAEATARVAATLDAALARPALAGYQTQTFFDQGLYIRQSIEQLRESALIGGALAVAVLFLFLRALGMTLLLTLCIPLCLLATVVVLYFSGDSLNVLSMMGLMLSVGMVVDNAIVVLENIDRRRRLGEEATAAAVHGAREVSLAITLATLTTLVVFLPMILLGDNPAMGFYMGKIGFPVCYALLASLGVALLYIPAGARRLALGGERRLGPVLRGLQDAYAGALAWALRHRTLAALGVIAVIGSTAIPFGRIRRVDRVEGGLDAVRVQLFGPANATLEELDATARGFEERLLARKDDLDIRAVLTHRGWSRQHVMIRVFFTGVDERRRPKEEAIAEIRTLLPERPGYEARIGWRGGGAGEDAGIQLAVTGPDTEVATELAQQIGAELERVPGVEQATLEDAASGTELRFVVARDAADRAGLDPLTIGGTIDYSLRGRRLADFQTGERELEVRVELAPEGRADADQLEQLAVARPAALGEPADRGGPSLALVTTRAQAAGYGQITRRDRQSRVTVNVTGDEAELFPLLQGYAARVRLPAGYDLSLGERFQERDKNEESGLFAVGVAIVLVFFLMGVLFESFILPFSIILSIPLAFAGVFWTLWLTDTPLDIMAIIGCIILVGVVVNNGIVLIDQVQHRRQAGMRRDEALVEAARQRVRPILMTALTTIGGLIPMALGNASILGLEYKPLGRVVIGGLIAGTALTLFAVPLLYALLDGVSHLPHRVRLLTRRVLGGTG
ncbi:MAG: efflux RND transporter permease subunit [Myxococcales bacterium]|nr:efflux RND transporter permease subunit [Myxococcales bacterium]